MSARNARQTIQPRLAEIFIVFLRMGALVAGMSMFALTEGAAVLLTAGV